MDEMTPRTAVEFAVSVEEMGGRLYAHFSKNPELDSESRALFARLSADEQVHQQQFSALLSAVYGRSKPTLNEESMAFRRADALNEFFGAKGGPFARRDDIHTSRDALCKALELERMTLAYYQALREALPNTDALDALIRTEARHVEEVTRILGQVVPSA